MTETGCVFCRIVAREAPATIVREWDDAIAIVPLNPVVPGHVLVIPTQHVETFFSSPDVSAATMRRAAELIHGVERHHEPRDHNIITSAGRAATQTVMHLHVHIVPRTRGDGLPLPWTPQQRMICANVPPVVDPARRKYLADLTDGWDSYGGKAPTPAALARLETISLVPTNRGGWTIEVTEHDEEASIEVGGGGRVQGVYWGRNR